MFKARPTMMNQRIRTTQQQPALRQTLHTRRPLPQRHTHGYNSSGTHIHTRYVLAVHQHEAIGAVRGVSLWLDVTRNMLRTPRVPARLTAHCGALAAHITEVPWTQPAARQTSRMCYKARDASEQTRLCPRQEHVKKTRECEPTFCNTLATHWQHTGNKKANISH